MPPVTTVLEPYWPAAEGGEWQRIAPAEAGFEFGQIEDRR